MVPKLVKLKIIAENALFLFPIHVPIPNEKIIHPCRSLQETMADENNCVKQTQHVVLKAELLSRPRADGAKRLCCENLI